MTKHEAYDAMVKKKDIFIVREWDKGVYLSTHIARVKIISIDNEYVTASNDAKYLMREAFVDLESAKNACYVSVYKWKPGIF